MLHVKRNRNTVIVWDDQKLTGIILAKCKKTEWEDVFDDTSAFKAELKISLHIEILLLDPEYDGNYLPVKKFLKGRNTKILEDDQNAKELYKFYYDNAMLKISLKGVEYNFIG